MNTTIKRTAAFSYFGSKGRHLEWLYSLFPSHELYDHYVEPFCGSAVVALNKKPSKIETINDANGRIMNFFRVLRSRKEELIEQLMLTPYHRTEFIEAFDAHEDELEDARRFFIRAMMGFGGAAHTKKRKHSWRVAIKFSHDGENICVEKRQRRIEGLIAVCTRLMDMQMENRTAEEVLLRYDSERTFFYVDPPYPFESRTGNTDYGNYEMTNEQHRALAGQLHSLNGLVAISGYNCELMDELYPTWLKHLGPTRASNMGKRKTQEVVWTNYRPQISLRLF